MMKKLLFITAVLCLSVYALNIKAQITVDSTDFAVAGDTIAIVNDTVPPLGISVGGTGAQTWDFTALQVDYLDTLRFRNVDNNTDDSLFTGSNLVMASPYQDSYLDFNSSFLNLLGFRGDPFGAGFPFTFIFDQPQKRMEFPSTSGSSFNDTVRATVTLLAGDLDPQLPVYGIDTVRFDHTGYITSQIDAYGITETPAGTFDCIRQLYVESTIDSIWAYCKTGGLCVGIFGSAGWSLVPPTLLPQAGLPAENPITDTTYTYRWLANSKDFPVVELETDSPAGNVLTARFKIDTAVVAWITSATNALCKDSCNGMATVTGISGVKPYSSYLWDDGQVTATATGLCAGTYSAMVIDAINDTSYAAVAVIGEPLALSGTTSITPANTPADNGTATISSVSGGTGTYTYSWSTIPPQTSATATGLAAGPYTVTITDANGCTFSATDTVTACTMSGTTSTTPDTNSTGVGTATISSVSGGTLPYSYSWNTTPPQSSATATGLAAGGYTITVTDTNGCTFSATDTVDLFTGINESIDAKNGIRIYPNPAVNELNVVAPLLKNGTVRIYNILGKQIMSVTLEGAITKVNTSELARGLYIYKVADVEGTVLKNGKFSVIR